MPNLVTNEQFAKEQMEMSRNVPEFPDIGYYETLLISQAGDRVKLLIAACDLLEIAKRHDPAYGLKAI
jgi:hypothetical protein